MEAFEFRVVQDGVAVASVHGYERAPAFSDIMHYAAVYGQDGPVTVQQRIGYKWHDVPVPA